MTETFVFHCVNVPAMRGGVPLMSLLASRLPKVIIFSCVGQTGLANQPYCAKWQALCLSKMAAFHFGEKPYRPHDPDISFQMAYLGHRDGLHGDLTGYENWHLLTGGKSDNKPIDPLYDRQLSSYSAGQRQRLSLLTLSFEADLWLLDEPSC